MMHRRCERKEQGSASKLLASAVPALTATNRTPIAATKHTPITATQHTAGTAPFWLRSSHTHWHR